MKTIFIQIASYRDPQLPKTLEDCLAKAKHPERLVFAICHQYGEDEDLSAFQGEQFKYISVPYQVSMGACWARFSTNTLYSGEDYNLQIDSHMRFSQDWDEKLIDMLESLPEKSFLTAYVPAYNAVTEEKLDAVWEMKIHPDLPKDIPCFLPSNFTADEPRPTLFFSGHFFFCKGEVINLIPYDRLLYFHGEEVTMAMRLYTHGYNGYHPHVPLIWHEYTREGRTKQWDDDKEWWRLDLRAKDRARQILKGELQDQLGGIRTAEEYIKAIGI
jgi:hypothetical protein